MRRRWLRKRWIASALLLLAALVFASLWNQRRQIAGGYIDRELARRGVQARYDIVDLGVGRQRLGQLVIGDPRRPDLTADWVELRISYGFRFPRVSRIIARGVRLNGRIVDGRLSLGQIDKLLPKPSGAPFSLPNVSLDLADAAMRLDTPIGRMAIAMRGKGHLAGGFRGTAVAVSRQLNLAGCTLERPIATVALSVRGRRPGLAGPIGAERLDCGSGLQAASPVFELDARLGQALDRWIGNARVKMPATRSGDTLVAGLGGRISFSGDARLTRGRIALIAAAARGGGLKSARVTFDGGYQASAVRRRGLIAGMATANRLSGRQLVAAHAAVLRGLGGTPLEPFGAALAGATETAATDLDVRSRMRLFATPNGTAIRVESLDASSRSGARLTLGGGAGLTIDGSSGISRIDARLSLSGGGFPTTEAILRQAQAHGPISGTVALSPFAVRGARLALAPVRLSGDGNGRTRIRTVATVEGAFSDGSVRRLTLPVTGRFGRGSFAFGEACTPVTFAMLRYGSLALGPSRLSLCPLGRGIVWKGPGADVRAGAEIRAPRLSGHLGSSPFALASDRFRFDLANAGFTGSNIAVRLGRSGYVNRLNLRSIDGRFTARGVEGRFAGGVGKIANVPLLLSRAAGRWQAGRGAAAVDASLIVADEADPTRFHPLRSDDFHLTLANNRIEAAGWLKNPETGTRVTRATIVHALDSNRGRATLDVPRLAFDQRFQPEQLTRLTLGVIALVQGEVKGRGEIVWGPSGTTSSGSFSTRGMNFAAPFGPVTGVTTTIHFSDLLGLETAPGQQASVERIQAGIDVFNGQVRYQLLPGLKVRVQAGHWPFAGGHLHLEETVLDFSQESAKQLTFRVEAMDAAAFVQQMQFTNIAATGTFDGVVPMVFDKQGGRIVGGRLVARSGGGNVSYIGELTEAQLGAYGKLAFDALKSLRYSKLIVTLDGALEGEFVAGVELDGIARNAPNPGGITGHALRQLAKIPFEFNIRANGPFRAIIGTMRSMKDPSGLIQQVLPQQIRDRPTVTVQPKESETVQ